MELAKEIKDAKRAYDHAWDQAAKYAAEALEAFEMHEMVQARDTSDMFAEKLRMAVLAEKNWRRAARLAERVLEEHFSRLRQKLEG